MIFNRWRLTDLARAELCNICIAGPATEYGPGEDNVTFTRWAEFIAATNTTPDIYTWHNLYAERTPTADFDFFLKQRLQYGLPERPIHINEYLAYSQIGPSIVIWYLSQLERLNIRGCRANWAKGGESPQSFHHLLGNLLGPMDLVAPFYTNGEYQAYKYYASMKGERVATIPPVGLGFDLFATIDKASKTVKILAGTRCNSRKYTITVSGFGSLGLSSKIRRRTLVLEWKGLFGEVQQPREVSTEEHHLENDTVCSWFIVHSVALYWPT